MSYYVQSFLHKPCSHFCWKAIVLGIKIARRDYIAIEDFPLSWFQVVQVRDSLARAIVLIQPILKLQRENLFDEENASLIKIAKRDCAVIPCDCAFFLIWEPCIFPAFILRKACDIFQNGGLK